MLYKIKETLYFYDRPLLAVFTYVNGDQFLGIHTEVKGWENPYLLTPLSEANYRRIIDNTMKLRDAFLIGGRWSMVECLDNKIMSFRVEFEEAQHHFPGDEYLRPR